ncbi:hypothetical protein [Puerhibacterium sp. TATVAM-FAB25]|uniref:hypothetical protein n=1 Tax=Puerhibacterium sp. TATVAM-FAB25 TaxID=3093699 RepID=UPI00397BE370
MATAGSAAVRRVVRAAVDHVRAAVRRERRDADLGAGRAEAASAAPVVAGPGGPAAGHRLAGRLSLGVTALMAAASATGLAWRGLYRDAPANAATFRAYDLGSLTVATPLLAGAMVRARRGSARAHVLWAGMLVYVVYTYAYYVFGAAFNALFLAHVVLLVLAAVALVLLLRSLDVGALVSAARARTPVRTVGVVLGALAASLGGMWAWFSLRFATTGAPPPEGLLLQPAPIGHLGYAMDLSTLVPAYATASVLLWRRRPWGHVLGGVLLVASAVIQVNYMLALAFQAREGLPGATAFDPQEPYIAATITVAAALLLAGLRSQPRPTHAGGPVTRAREPRVA